MAAGWQALSPFCAKPARKRKKPPSSGFSISKDIFSVVSGGGGGGGGGGGSVLSGSSNISSMPGVPPGGFSEKERAEELRSRNRRHAASCRKRKRQALDTAQDKNAELAQQLEIHKQALHGACEALEYLKMGCVEKFGQAGERLVTNHATFVEELLSRDSLATAVRAKKQPGAKTAAPTGWANNSGSMVSMRVPTDIAVQRSPAIERPQADGSWAYPHPAVSSSSSSSSSSSGGGGGCSSGSQRAQPRVAAV